MMGNETLWYTTSQIMGKRSNLNSKIRKAGSINRIVIGVDIYIWEEGFYPDAGSYITGYYYPAQCRAACARFRMQSAGRQNVSTATLMLDFWGGHDGRWGYKSWYRWVGIMYHQIRVNGSMDEYATRIVQSMERSTYLGRYTGWHWSYHLCL